MKQAGSTLRVDTNHFYNCLQQERKHELNSSVVDGFREKHERIVNRMASAFILGFAAVPCDPAALCRAPGLTHILCRWGLIVWSSLGLGWPLGREPGRCGREGRALLRGESGAALRFLSSEEVPEQGDPTSVGT